MSARKKILTAVLVLVLLSPVLAILMFAASGPLGTPEQAAAKLRSQPELLHQIVLVGQNDSALGWVEPYSDVKSFGDPKSSVTPQSIRDYQTVSQLLKRNKLRSLEFYRPSGENAEFIRFVVFEPGWFGEYKPVLAEWTQNPEELDHSAGMPCVAIRDDWYACATDP